MCEKSCFEVTAYKDNKGRLHLTKELCNKHNQHYKLEAVVKKYFPEGHYGNDFRPSEIIYYLSNHREEFIEALKET